MKFINFTKTAMSRLTVFLMAILMSLSCIMPVHASENQDHLWVRAKISYEFDKALEKFGDEAIHISSDKWKKDGDWYYYQDALNSGQTVTLFDSVTLPTSWGNSTSEKKFNITVTVECAEVIPGETGWNESRPASFSQDFNVWYNGYSHAEDVYVQQGNISVSLKEYQLDKDGKKVSYVNNKRVLPGQKISKIVEITVLGDRGGIVQIKPEKPVKSVTQDGVNVDGKTLKAGSVVQYNITVKNPAPFDQNIRVIDNVDDRLWITDTMGGTITSGTAQGGVIEWTIPVKGGKTGTVSFKAKLPNASEEGGTTIPNTAQATISGHTLDTNTVIVSIGPATVLQKIAVRATGDKSILIYYVLGFAAVAAVAGVVIKAKRARG